MGLSTETMSVSWGLTKPDLALCPQLDRADIKAQNANAPFNPGCVKSRNKITRASQKNRTRRSNEFKMFLRAPTYINVAR